MKKIYSFLSLLLTFAVAGAQINGNFSAVADNTIYQDATGNSNGIGENFFAGANNGLSPRRGLIKFNLPAGNVTINSVTLTLYCTKSRFGTDPVSLHKANSSWGEGTSNAGTSNDGSGVGATSNDATWNQRFFSGTPWGTAGGDFVATASATTNISSVDVTYTWSTTQMVADVQSWINSPATNFGWLLRGDETTTQSAKRFATKENSTVANRPVLTINYTVLPVTLTSFKAKEIKTGVLLNWETAQEFNNAFFSIEHSIDGIGYASVGRVAGNGTSALPHTYQYKHEGIDAGSHYYRLAQTDINGRINYSPVVSITLKNKYTVIQISPNPVANKIILQGSSATPGNRYSIINQTGVVVLSGTIKSNALDVSTLPKAVYCLRLQQADGLTLSGQFIKQ